MTAKEKKKLFDVIEFVSVEQAEKEFNKQKILFIVKGIGTLLALIGTIMIFASGENKTLLGLGFVIGIIGELAACLGYKLFIYAIKVFFNMLFLIPIIAWLPFGLMLGVIIGVGAVIYAPVLYSVISLVETYRNYSDAKAYLELHTTISKVAEYESEMQNGVFAQSQPAEQAQPVVSEVEAQPVAAESAVSAAEV